MLKTIAFVGLAAALALSAGAALAESGTSSAYGTEGWGPRIPTQSLTPFDREWNHDNQSKYEAEAGAAWLRKHGRSGPFPWFQ
jgi:hypothetical protein